MAWDDVPIPPVPDLCWPIDAACLTEDWDALTPEVQERAAMLAVSSLRSLTAYRVGGCPITVRPCKKSCCIPGFYAYGGYDPGFDPQNWNGIWTNGCGCYGDCGCSASCETRLPGPIGDLVEVNVAGTPLPLTDFRVDNENILVYQGSGDCPFNMEQDLSSAVGAPGTWSVTYVNAHKPDALAAYAAGVLAVQFALACSGNKKCRLPANVIEVVRNGVSMTITPGTFPDGVTGIREVDAFIRLWKPPGSPAYAPIVWSPDLGEVRHTTRSF